MTLHRAPALLALLLAVAPARAQPGIDVAVPVHLRHARAVFNVDRAILSGDTPTVFVWLDEMLIHFERWRTRRKLIVLLHGPAGAWALGDDAWNRTHGGMSGNPFAARVAALRAARVRFEICAYTMELNGWTNADLLPGVAVTTGAIARLIELEQRRWTVLQP